MVTSPPEFSGTDILWGTMGPSALAVGFGASCGLICAGVYNFRVARSISRQAEERRACGLLVKA